MKSCSFKQPVIVVGNLSFGGTGKSPHTLFLAKLLSSYKPAILSRGYGRSTNGFIYVRADSSASEVGDEPLMFKNYLPHIEVAVCENRCDGVSRLLGDEKKSGLVILDDAFQHRALKPGLSVLLFDYSSLEENFFLVPAGKRRDIFSRWKSADVIIATKTPKDFEIQMLENKFPGKAVFSSRYIYKELSSASGLPMKFEELSSKKVLLLTGIADASDLKKKLNEYCTTVVHLEYPDHHKFEEKELRSIRENMVMFAPENYLFITTAKDFMRLKSLLNEQELNSWLIAEIEVEINKPKEFESLIRSYVERNQ